MCFVMQYFILLSPTLPLFVLFFLPSVFSTPTTFVQMEFHSFASMHCCANQAFAIDFLQSWVCLPSSCCCFTCKVKIERLFRHNGFVRKQGHVITKIRFEDVKLRDGDVFLWNQTVRWFSQGNEIMLFTFVNLEVICDLVHGHDHWWYSLI